MREMQSFNRIAIYVDGKSKHERLLTSGGKTEKQISHSSNWLRVVCNKFKLFYVYLLYICMFIAMPHLLLHRLGWLVKRIYDVCAFEELFRIIIAALKVFLQQLLLVPLELVKQYSCCGRG